MIDKMIGGFRILDEIKVGSGGQGRVFKAICEKAPFSGIELGTVVALKVMPAYHKSAEAWARLEKRTGELVRLSHPNIVKYYGCFSEPGIFYDIHAIVQEWLEGETLKQRLARNPHGLDADEALHVTDSALAGLDYVAVNGIVHRDVKPSNIFLCLDADDAISCVKLIDFEVAHQKGDATTVSMTNGKIVGSFDYMAPDFTNPGFYGDERSDVFSMGVVMHETITGRTPCQRIEGKSGRADFAFLTRWDRLHEDGTNPIKISPRANRLLAHSGEVLAKALAPLPQDRYQTFAEFHEGFKTISYHEIKGGGNTYRFLQQIRCDDFCEVFKARILDTGRLVVVKSFSDGNDGRRLRHEGMILLKLKELLKSKDTSYFMECLDYFTISDKIDATELPWDSLKAFLVMEYLPGMPGNTLRDAIRAANGAQLPRRETFIAFARYAHALAILHKHGIVHRDIKPSNLYFPDGHPENAVLIGFTIACDVTRTQSAEGVVGTLAYMPPESVLTNNCGDSRRDIYALGLSLYEALTGKTAYPRLPLEHAVITLITRAKNKELPSFDSPVVTSRPELLQLLKDMTNIDPEKRIRDAAEVERKLSELAATVNEQDQSGVLCLDDAPLSTKNDNATKNSEMKPDEVPTDDAATLNPASDTETGGCRVEATLTSWKIAADGFQCRRVIGRGGQSVVFEAVCTKPVLDGINVGAKVALKVLNGYGSDDDLRKFNELNKRLPSSVVRHYGCIRVCRGNDSATAIVMDLLQGETLRTRLCRRPHGLDVDEAVGIMKSLVITLSSLHSLGVIHRDIKPGNVFIGHDGCVTLLDFTSAKWNGDAIEPMEGRGIGTPKYRAPEMKSPDFTGDEKSDIYSASLVLREMLCGNTDDEVGSKSKTRWSGLERFRHGKPTENDRIADVGKLSSDLLRIIRKGLSIRYWRYGTCDGLLADLEKIRFPIYEYDNHRYMRLSYERCSGCGANGVAYGKMLDIGTGQVFKWKTFKMDVVKPRKYDEYASWCPYSLGETRLGLWSWLAKVKDNCLRLDLESAFPIRDGKKRLLLLVYSRGMGAPDNTLRYQGKVLCAKPLEGLQHDTVSLTKRLSVSDALIAFARYARGVSILHEAGIETVGVAPDILLYEEGKPSASSITTRRYDCCCEWHFWSAGPGYQSLKWSSDWWQSESCLTFFYRLPNGDRCDAFALGLCLYEIITGRKGYAAPLLDKYGHIIHRGNLSIDFDDPILVKHADIADVIRQMTEIDKRRRLRDMRKIEDALRTLSVKYRLAENEVGALLKCEVLSNKTECSSFGLSGCTVDARMSSLMPSVFSCGRKYTKEVDYMSNVLVALRKVTSRKYIVPRMIRNIAEGPFMGIPESKDLDEYRECSPRNHCDCSVPEVFYEGDPDVT